jgi:hypothetical protein
MNFFFFIVEVTEDFVTDPHPHPDSHLDPLLRGTDPRIRIRIRTKMSRIWNTGLTILCTSLTEIIILSEMDVEITNKFFLH